MSLESTILTCSCGAKLRVPADSQRKSFSCPKCKSVFATATDAQVIQARPVVADNQVATCPICQTSIHAGENAIDCPKCSQRHHHECWTEVGGCSTYGCPQAPAAEKESATAQPLAAWGDEKTCPVCGEKIKAIALKCRYCETTFDTVDPLSMRDLHRKDRRATERKTICNTVIALFAITMIGCTAPIMLFVNMIYILPKRKELALAGPFYLILGYSAVGLAVLYSILIVFAVLIGGLG
jgi:hypothetical protein